jgi:hypothetical protein
MARCNDRRIGSVAQIRGGLAAEMEIFRQRANAAVWEKLGCAPQK